MFADYARSTYMRRENCASLQPSVQVIEIHKLPPHPVATRDDTST